MTPQSASSSWRNNAALLAAATPAAYTARLVPLRPISSRRPREAPGMKLHEFQAKEVFARFGIATPRGRAVMSGHEAEAAAHDMGRAVVKAQVLVGGRGKAGGI